MKARNFVLAICAGTVIFFGATSIYKAYQQRQARIAHEKRSAEIDTLLANVDCTSAQSKLDRANGEDAAHKRSERERDVREQNDQSTYRTYLNSVVKSRKAIAELQAELVRSKIASSEITPAEGVRQIKEIKAANEKEIEDILSRAPSK